MRRRIRALWVVGLLLPVAVQADEPQRTVIIALDAVPYDTVAELTDPSLGDERIFPDFKGPVPLISTFPSTTSLAMAAILEPFGLEPSPGYEAKYYDRERNEVRGGGLISYNKIVFPWREFFDWKIRGIRRKWLEALHPIKSSLRAVEESLDAFIHSDKPVFFVYYDATDLAGHLKSPEAIKPTLRELDQTLRRLRAEHPDRPFQTILFSDHGMAGGQPLRNVRKGVHETLRQRGFELSERIRSRRDVVLAPFGLVSSLVAFTARDQERRVAAGLAEVEGVDLCVFPQDGGWYVESRRGTALVRRRSHGALMLWSYRPLTGDPLGYQPVVERLRTRHPDGDGWFPDRWWFRATGAADYPDALYRLAEAFDLVENPASVVCSLAPGYMYGSALANFGMRLSRGRLRWTHGALLQQASFGFLMSDIPGWQPPDVARFSGGLRAFADGSQGGDEPIRGVRRRLAIQTTAHVHELHVLP